MPPGCVVHGMRSSRRKRQGRNRDGSTADGCLHISFGTQLTVLQVYVATDFCAPAAVAFLRRRTMQRFVRQASRIPQATWERLVELWFLQCPPGLLYRISVAESPLLGRLVGLAQRFATEWRLASWVRAQNSTTVRSLRTQTLVDCYRTLQADVPGAVDHFYPADPHASGSTRAWLSRWRRVHGIRYGPLRCRDALPAAEARLKARTARGCVGWEPVHVPEIGTGHSVPGARGGGSFFS